MDAQTIHAGIPALRVKSDVQRGKLKSVPLTGAHGLIKKVAHSDAMIIICIAEK